MSFWIGNIVLVVLNIPMIGIWTRVLAIPYRMLYPVGARLRRDGHLQHLEVNFDIWIVLVAGGGRIHFQGA